MYNIKTKIVLQVYPKTFEWEGVQWTKYYQVCFISQCMELLLL